MKNLILLSATGFILLTGCSIEKRHYMNGYNVQWNKKVYTNTDTKEASNFENNQNMTASVSEDIVPIELNRILMIGNTSIIEQGDSCDIIKLKNKGEIKAKVLEISTSTIKYKDCNDLNGKEKSISKKEISGITYRNGKKENEETFKYVKSEDSTSKETPSYIEKKSSLNTVLHPKARLAITFGPMSFIPFVGWVFAIMAILYGIFALKEIKKNPEMYRGKKHATIGWILGVTGLVLGILIVSLFLFAI